MQELSPSALAKPVSRLRVSMNERHLLQQEKDGWARNNLRVEDTVPSKLEAVLVDLYCSLGPGSIWVAVSRMVLLGGRVDVFGDSGPFCKKKTPKSNHYLQA